MIPFLRVPFVPALMLLPAILAAAPIAVSETTLANGLRVAVYENHSAPVAAVDVWYEVGSYYERSGHTGLSHLLEHLMFQGTSTTRPGEYDRRIEAAGGDNNAFTSDHYTVFWAELAADRFELELQLEADRMQYLTLDSANFERERNVVMEERRLGENSPYEGFWEDFYALAYKIHPYRNPVIGWMDDLARLRHHDIVEHYRKYYTPSNALMVVAGDVEPRTVFARAARHFGRIKARPVEPWRPVEPEQVGERRMVVRRDVTTPALMTAWHVPGSSDSAWYAIEVIDALLLRGKSSRLYDKLLYQRRRVLEIEGGSEAQTEPGLFYIFAVPRDTVQMDSLERDLYAELESLKSVPVGDSELTRVKNQLVASFIYRQDANSDMAYRVGHALTMYGSVDFLNRYADRIAAVTREDIMRAARRCFVEDNRCVGRLMPSSNNDQ